MRIWPGDFNNQQRVNFDARANPAGNDVGNDVGNDIAARFHAKIQKLDMWALGEHVLRLKETRADNFDSLHH